MDKLNIIQITNSNITDEVSQINKYDIYIENDRLKLENKFLKMQIEQYKHSIDLLEKLINQLETKV